MLPTIPVKSSEEILPDFDAEQASFEADRLDALIDDYADGRRLFMAGETAEVL